MEYKRKATLRLFLKDEILAYELATTVDLINETYTSLRWLELAELHSGTGLYDDSEFAPDEFLRVPRVEIGTPNFLDLYGLLGTLHDTLTYLVVVGGVGVIPKLLIKSVDQFIDLRTKWIESRLKKIELEHKQNPERQRLEMQKLKNEEEKGRLENEKLRRELQEMVSGKRTMESITEVTRRLYRGGKASEAVLTYKTKAQEILSEKHSAQILDDVVKELDLIPDDEDEQH